MNAPKPQISRSSPVAFAGFWLLFTVQIFLMYVAVEPDFAILHHIPEITPRECMVGGASFSFISTLSIAACEKLFNRKLLHSLALIILGIWGIALIYVIYFTPLVMMVPA
ncbi:MAG TPA: hypothetical protein VIU46_06770 [Gallionellaceae bacterium]